MPDRHRTLPSPVGTLTLIANDAGLCAILWEGDDPGRVTRTDSVADAYDPVLADAAGQLAEYFAGTRTDFSLPLAFAGTPFQQEVWRALCTIPHGETRSYADIARQIGRPSATRAVGAANGRNPISIVAPCHRVIGANGSLTGFAGGMEAKRWLLTHEGALLA